MVCLEELYFLSTSGGKYVGENAGNGRPALMIQSGLPAALSEPWAPKISGATGKPVWLINKQNQCIEGPTYDQC